MIAETMQYGGASRETAEKVDRLWIDIMKEYLAFTSKSEWRHARNSAHHIHLCDPQTVREAADAIAWPQDNRRACDTR
jgi:hypothetical protein